MYFLVLSLLIITFSSHLNVYSFETNNDVDRTYDIVGTTYVMEPKNEVVGNWTITGYCACIECCGQWAVNRPKDENGNEIIYGASGRRLESGYSCATNSLPLGTLIEIEGLGIWRVDDRGTVGIDLYYDTHERACTVGCQTRQVTVLGGESY